jgi:hypothetical protein
MLKTTEQFEFNWSVLESILASSASDNNERFPTNKRLILADLIKGTLDFMGETSKGISRSLIRNDLEGHLFKKSIDNYRNEVLNSDKIAPRIKKAIFKLTELNYKHILEGPGDGSYACNLYGQYGGYIPNSPWPFKSFSIPETLKGVKKEMPKHFSKEEIGSIEGIGEAMRKHINKDLQYSN